MNGCFHKGLMRQQFIFVMCINLFFAVCINVIVVPVCGTACTHALSVKVMSYMTLINMAILTYVLCWHNSSMLKETFYAQNNVSIMWKSLTSRQSCPSWKVRRCSHAVQYIALFGGTKQVNQSHCSVTRQILLSEIVFTEAVWC